VSDRSAIEWTDATWGPEDPAGRWRAFDDEELLARDRGSLDIFWLKNESLERSENLPDPDVIAADIADDLRAALEQFEEVAADLGGRRG
jgi:type I restriction enzyme M protein